MKRRGQMKKQLLIMLLSLIPLHLAAKDGVTVLRELAKDLEELRALPIGANASNSCPTELDSLVGMSQDVIEAILPKPDWSISKTKRSYFLASPRPPDLRGGGFPEVTFRYNKSNVLEKVACFYSR